MNETITKLRSQPVAPQKLLIGGSWRAARDEATLDVVSPIDGSKLTTIAAGKTADVDAAVSAARRAFEGKAWSRAAPAERKKVLWKAADLMQREALALAVLAARDNGMALNTAMRLEIDFSISVYRYYAEAIDKVYGEIAPTAENFLGLVHREPVGVVGIIVPWNTPLLVSSWKIAAALATGNSIVVKPSEEASLALLRVAELLVEAGLPEGALNIVTGTGAEAGKAIGLHHDIDVVAFTGSGRVGRQLLEYSAQSNLKRVYLELGGKSPNIVFADAPDIERAALFAALAIFDNAGQVCVAGSRLLVERPIFEAFTGKVQQIAEGFRVGDPLDSGTDIGAIANLPQLRRNLDFIEKAHSEGSRLRTGGRQILQETGGYYMTPTIFEVNDTSILARDEVFGPVLAVMPFETEEEAVRIANSTSYGLSSQVWTGSLSRAHRMIGAIKAGIVNVNTFGGGDMTVPFGGVKQSGNGYDKSLHALDKYVDLKTAWIDLG